jgi:hypothetical protein
MKCKTEAGLGRWFVQRDSFWSCEASVFGTDDRAEKRRCGNGGAERIEAVHRRREM